MKYLYYSYEEVINDKDLIFNLRLDWTFKNVFLSKECFNYLCLMLSKVLNLNYEDVKNNLIVISSELPSNKIETKSSYSDIICKYKGLYIIIEMNNGDKDLHINKNYYYLFKQHSSRISRKNKYRKFKKTILINIDTYDVLNKEEFLYTSKLYHIKYNRCLYNNIKVIHINLDCLERKYYNNVKLNELEKIFLIFVEQRKDMLLKLINIKEVIEVIGYMERLNFREGEPVTYDRDEFERIEKEIFEKKKNNFYNQQKKFIIKQRQFDSEQKQFNNKQKQFDNKQKQFNNKQKQFDNKQKQFDDRVFEIAKVLKEKGVSDKRIIELTDIPIEKIYEL